MGRILVLLLMPILFFSCGGSLQSPESVSDKVDTNYERGALVFDPFSTDAFSPIGVPFPNDIFLTPETRDGDSYLYFDPDKAKDNATRVLYEALNQLQLKGFSPNMPIFVPLASDYPIDLNTLKNNYRLIDLTALTLASQNATYASLIDQSNRLIFRQDGSYLKFYPVKPLEPGHQYLFVLLKGIKDVSGRDVLPPSIFLELESDKPLDNPELEALRESYAPLFNEVLPNFNLTKEDVLELFTFTTANKTLSVSDFAAISAYLKEEVGSLNVTGIAYSNVTQDYGLINGLVDEVYSLVKENSSVRSYIENITSGGSFPAFDISKLMGAFKLGELNDVLIAIANQTLSSDDYLVKIPVYLGNNDTEHYNGTVYIFQHGLGGNRTQAEKLLNDIDLPVVAIDLPYHGDYMSENGTFLGSNPIANRMNIYQAVFNLRLLEKLLRGGFYDVDGDGKLDNVTSVDFLGISMGAIVGSIYAKYGTPDKVVLNVGGANYASIVDAATNQLIEGLLEAAGVKKNTYTYAYMLGITQLIQDPADPVYVGIDNGTNVILQNAYGDTVVPNVSNTILAKRVGFDNYTTVLNTEPPSTPGWYMFGNETYWGVHSFLLGVDDAASKYPEAAEHINQDVIDELGELARQQVNDFFNSP